MDYSPFGVTLTGRGVSGDYRYSYQNQEVDNEIKGNGNSVNYKYRMHDPRVGRFFAVDPKYYHDVRISPYAFSSNLVIDRNEIGGLSTGPPWWAPYTLSAKHAGLTPQMWTRQSNFEPFLEQIHMMLDAAGLIPVVGEVFDVFNCIIYSFEGDYVNAGISLAAVIPVYGDAGKIAKYTVKIGDKAGTAAKVTRSFKKPETMARFLDDCKEYGELAADALWDSGKLKKELKGVLKAGEEAHHLIPVNLVKNNDVIKAALEGGYNINAKGNGIGLSSVKNGGVHAKHSNYTKQVDAKIKKWAEKNEGYTPEMAREFLEGLEKDLFEQVKKKCKNDGQKVNEIKID